MESIPPSGAPTDLVEGVDFSLGGEFGACSTQDEIDESIVGCTTCSAPNTGGIIYFESASNVCGYCYCEFPAAVDPYIDLCAECASP